MSTPTIPGTPPGVTPFIQIGIGDRYDASATAAVWDVARWSTAGVENEWGGQEPLWNDVTCDVVEVTTFAGRDNAIDPFEVGTATVVVRNLDGWADYKPPSDTDNILTLRPGRQIRVGVAVGPGTPAIPGSPGYLTPTVGTVSTPDPGPLPDECCFLFHIVQPTWPTGGVQALAYQWGDPDSSWLHYRDWDGSPGWTKSLTGSGGSTEWQRGSLGQADEEFAVAVQHSTGTIQTWARRSDMWTLISNRTGLVGTPFDASRAIVIGGSEFAGTRIYSVELRTGLYPTTGDVLWRFDADDYPGTGTSYVDPRGRTWTLTNASAITPKVPAVPAAAAVPVWLWRGVIDATAPDYTPDEMPTVTIGCIDAKGDAGRAQMPKALGPVYHGDLGHVRFWRILNVVSWPEWRRDFTPDTVTLGATEFGSSAASELDRTAESASSYIYGDTAGRIAYRKHDFMVWSNADPPDATIGNIDGDDVCPSGWEIRFNREDITTRVIAGRQHETPLIMDNPDGIAEFGVETWERTDLLPLDNFELSRIGSRVLNSRSPATMPRIASVSLHASTGAGEVAELLAGASPFTPARYRCRHRAVDGRTVFDRMMLLVGIEHSISPIDGWSARLVLDDASTWRNVDNPAHWSDAATKWSDIARWPLNL